MDQHPSSFFLSLILSAQSFAALVLCDSRGQMFDSGPDGVHKPACAALSIHCCKPVICAITEYPWWLLDTHHSWFSMSISGTAGVHQPPGAALRPGREAVLHNPGAAGDSFPLQPNV